MIRLLTNVLLWGWVYASIEEKTQLAIDQGQLIGSYQNTWNGRTFSSFTGIPYAKPPINELRFKASIPADAWEGILDATKNHPICPQMNVYVRDFTVKGDEDCLYLNVYTPQLETSANPELLPVMFFIHGGGWMCGSANLYGPKVLLDQDVVLVTINYRLGALGFLTTGDSVVSGNNGLKDQNLALKWVKNNIVHFGGDPNKITIFGQSAGGASTHFHVLSPLSKDLINGAIFHSGSALAPWALGLPTLALNNTKNLAKFVNCPYPTSEVLIDCLRKLPADYIIAQDLKFMEWAYHPMIPFKPVIENESDEAFLTEEPINIIKSNKAANVPIITGITTEDGALKSSYVFSQENLSRELNDDFSRIAPFLFVYHESSSDQNTITDKIRKFYFGDKDIDESVKGQLTNVITDCWFRVPAEATIRLHRQYSDQKVFYYLFGYRGSETFASFHNDANDNFDYGVCHTDDLMYLFNINRFTHYKPDKRDEAMNHLMSSLWTNFAKVGDPTPITDKRIKVKWNPVQSKSHEYYFIGDDVQVQMKSNMNPERLQIWDKVPFNARWEVIRDEL